VNNVIIAFLVAFLVALTAEAQTSQCGPTGTAMVPNGRGGMVRVYCDLPSPPRAVATPPPIVAQPLPPPAPITRGAALLPRPYAGTPPAVVPPPTTQPPPPPSAPEPLWRIGNLRGYTPQVLEEEGVVLVIPHLWYGMVRGPSGEVLIARDRPTRDADLWIPIRIPTPNPNRRVAAGTTFFQVVCGGTGVVWEERSRAPGRFVVDFTNCRQ